MVVVGQKGKHTLKLNVNRRQGWKESGTCQTNAEGKKLSAGKRKSAESEL